MEIEITRLDWDSNFFQLEIGSLQIDYFKDSLIPEIENKKRDHGYDLIYLFIQKIEAGQIATLTAAGARLVDEKITFHKKILGPEKSLMHFERYEAEVSPRLLELAIASGHQSRFFKDPRTNSRFTELYRTWIENSVKRSVADEVLVTHHNDEISGFVTLKKKDSTGTIGLIAVHESMRGMGIGKELIIAANNWYVTNGCTEAIVVTQKENEKACSLYERMGYRIANTQYIFHI